MIPYSHFCPDEYNLHLVETLREIAFKSFKERTHQLYRDFPHNMTRPVAPLYEEKQKKIIGFQPDFYFPS